MRIKNKSNRVLVFIILIFLSSCHSCVPPPPPPPPPGLNIIVLLDLSDRIIMNEKQPKRDQQLINHICYEFGDYIKDVFMIREPDETIKIRVAYQDNIPYSTSQYLDSLYFQIDSDFMLGMPAVRRVLEGRFTRNINQLYNSAVYSQNPDDYAGANLSRYFIQNLKYDIKDDTLTRNLLFILTDGYVVVGDNRNAMLDVHNKFPNLEVMVLEVDPLPSDYETELLEKSWDRWFSKMNIEGFAFLYNNRSINEISNVISEFMMNSLTLIEPGEIPEIDTIEYIPPDTTDINPSRNVVEYRTSNDISDLLNRLISADYKAFRDTIIYNIENLCVGKNIIVDKYSGTSPLSQPYYLDNYLKEVKFNLPAKIIVKDFKKDENGKYTYFKIRQFN